MKTGETFPLRSSALSEIGSPPRCSSPWRKKSGVSGAHGGSGDSGSHGGSGPPWAMVGSPRPKFSWGSPQPLGGVLEWNSVSFWNGAGSGVDSVSSWNRVGFWGHSGSADSRGRSGSTESRGRSGSAELGGTSGDESELHGASGDEGGLDGTNSRGRSGGADSQGALLLEEPAQEGAGEVQAPEGAVWKWALAGKTWGPVRNSHWRALARSGAGQPRELRGQRAGRD